MQVSDIEFVKLVGIEQEGNALTLEYKNDILNHLNTIHASAQFTLAETQSGLYLQTLFPDLVANVVPVLRESSIKYKKPAKKKLLAFASVTEKDKEKFREQFTKKGRASLSVHVEVKDVENIVTAVATFSWFVQKI